jgi:hypothetical protein
VIDGCTAFEQESLVCVCRETDRGWSMSLVARSAPVVYLIDSYGKTLEHELRHIEDIRTALNALLETWAQRTFDSQGDCQRAAGIAPTNFRWEMNALRYQSQERYH